MVMVEVKVRLMKKVPQDFHVSSKGEQLVHD